MSRTGSAPVILVVEDELLIRFDMSDILREAGFAVIEAASADEAMEIVRSGARVDLVFSDIQMPGSMNGIEMARRLLGEHPGLPVILTSGASATVSLGPALAAIGRIEPKPYEPDFIVGRIRTALAAAPSA